MTTTLRGSDNFDSGQKLTAGTAQNTTSGTSIDFTSIPSWVKRITVMFNGVSLSGAATILVQLGAGSVTTTGYSGSGTYVSTVTGNTTSGAQQTAGFLLLMGGASATISGTVTLTLLGANTWTCSGVLNQPTIGNTQVGGAVTLSGTLDRLRITSSNGTDTFDAGSVNILYE